MTITALPTPPSRADDPATFASKGDALLGALPTFVTETNAAIVEANASVALAAGQVTLATTQAGIATTQAGNASDSALSAENSAQAAAASAGAVAWVSGTTYALGAVVWSPVDRLTYRRMIAGAGATDPSADLVNWAALNPVATQAEMQAGTEVALRAMSPLRIAEAIESLAIGKLFRSDRTSNTMIGASDKGTLIDITSGTFTQTFDSCAALGNGWVCYLQNSGTGDITLDPIATETIDGMISYIMYPKEVRIIHCDGTALRSVVINTFCKDFTASGDFTKPPGYSAFSGFLWGGGASGGRGAAGTGAGGGGACVPFTLKESSVANVMAFTIGSGGAARATNGSPNAGGNSTFGSLVTALGASALRGGHFGPASNTFGTVAFDGGAQGDSSTGWAGEISIFGGGGGGGDDGSTRGNGGDSFYGGGGGGSSAIGGVSVIGGNGGAGATTSIGGGGVAPGGGGGSTRSGAQSGAGARGELRIWGVL